MSDLRQHILQLIAALPDERLPQLLALLQRLDTPDSPCPETMTLVAQILEEDAQLLHRLAQ